MSVAAQPRCRRSRTAGLSIVEVLISIAIVAMLLTAVAAAFSASSQIINENDQFFRATQAARVSINQILTEARRSQAVDVHSTSTGLNLVGSDGLSRSYVYNSDTGVISMVTTANYTLASNVTSCSFSIDTMTDAGQIQHVVRVSVALVVQVGNNQVRLSGSAAPRNEVTYN